jgi:choline dehydrogenase
MSYDFIIVGGGSAGCALAKRLSEDPDTNVLVLEAGRNDSLWDVYIHMPAALSFPIGNRLYDWKYESEPEAAMHGRRIYHARGKVLGGSSSINGMIFQRGNPLDYERWAADPGMETWDYAHCLPYFKRMETCIAGSDDFRGADGPLKLERGPATSPLFTAFFEAVQQAGYPLTDDVNGYRQEGFAPFDRNIYHGRRWSAARAYLHPVMGRENLDVRCNTFVSRVLFEGKRAVGVEISKRGSSERVFGGEVILSGGAINSPQLLQLSGVGNADELGALGIEVVENVPAIGENLQDHLEVYVQYSCTQPVSVAPAIELKNRPKVGLEWLLLRKGAGATNHFEAGGFIRSNDDVPYPNLMFHFLPIAIRYDGSAPQGHGYQVHVGPMYSDARGTIKIVSTDPHRHPALRFNYLTTDQDRREWVEAIRCARKILTQPAFDPYNGGELSPGESVSTDEEVLDWVARDAETALHPSCTCRMGVGEDSVTDPLTLRVHGLDGLRVVDASAMRYVTNGNIYAPTMMLAEKAADLIRGNTPLPPINVPFYRHQPGVTAAAELTADGAAANGSEQSPAAATSGATEP